MRYGSNISSRRHLVIGRAAEVAYLEQCLEAALGGKRQVVFVSGEPGIGKTTIVDTFLRGLESRVQSLGTQFLGSLDEAERNPGSARDTPDSAPLHPGYMG